MTRSVQVLLLLGVVWLAAGSGAQTAGDAESPPDPTELLRRAEASVRGGTTTLVAHLSVTSARGSTTRKLSLEALDDRKHGRSFVRILSPSKSAGTGYLKLPPNVWRYTPRLKSIVRISSDRMLQPWERSDFSLDDWLHVTDELRDYQPEWLRAEADGDGREGGAAHVVALRPREGADVTWGRIEVWIEMERGVPLRRDFFDREGTRVRTLRYDDFRDVDGRLTPHLWVMTPTGDTGRKTRVALERVVFDGPIPDTTFSARNLKGVAPQ